MAIPWSERQGDPKLIFQCCSLTGKVIFTKFLSALSSLLRHNRKTVHVASAISPVQVNRPLPDFNDPLTAMMPDHLLASYVGADGPEEFALVGRVMVDRFRAYAGLKPDEKILEVGCGIGRIAIPLTQYLTSGSYVGFDIVPHGIEWCQQNVTPRYPHFTFFVADVHNKFYHPEGRYAASEYVFPFPDASFDFVFLTSVFTHMLPNDLERYALEIGRVLRPGGRCFCTAYVISAEARTNLINGTSLRAFTKHESYWTDTPSNPEAAIAYSEEYLCAAFKLSLFEIERIIPGEWWKNPLNQDILVAKKIKPSSLASANECERSAKAAVNTGGSSSSLIDGIWPSIAPHNGGGNLTHSNTRVADTTLANRVISLSVNAARGNSIASLRVLGIETVDTSDLGRGIQASVYFPTTPNDGSACAGVNIHWLNLQSAGNDENVASRISLPPTKTENSISVATYPQMSPSGGELWEDEPDHHFCIYTKYALGPMPDLPFPELIQLDYRFRATRALAFSHAVCDQRNCPTIVPFIPLAFFKANVLTRLFGLDTTWHEFHPRAETVYHPSQYRQRAMAWMRPDLGWGVALYGPQTISNLGVDNFTAQKFPNYGVNQLCLVDQSLGVISASCEDQYDAASQRTAYIIVGNTSTIGHIISCIDGLTDGQP